MSLLRDICETLNILPQLIAEFVLSDTSRNTTKLPFRWVKIIYFIYIDHKLSKENFDEINMVLLKGKKFNIGNQFLK